MANLTADDNSGVFCNSGADAEVYVSAAASRATQATLRAAYLHPCGGVFGFRADHGKSVSRPTCRLHRTVIAVADKCCL